ncbi:hypothetical protein OCC_05079 [Thermococcus litoralis DSM 5473]|uniref:Uncharacterized protein n=1 Tax=Thermococcus litoralis (strain ATCC 51850 / DSM 5473 / JCM 8560 / NS-C) TaxID=523849 RepID=H3ZN77_THELN|nr:hypothetical protein [Thermococcus litoralis]EHR78588.1 hypothetical protein OCC_05079 [Thermococcus litoralis DSM 5473]
METKEYKVGIFKIVLPASYKTTVGDIEELQKVYQAITEEIGTRYYLEFIPSDKDIQKYSSKNRYSYTEGPYKLEIVREGSSIYIHNRGYSSKFIIEKLMFLALLEQGFSRIHGGGVQDLTSKSVMILAGSGGVGKTTTILSLLMKNPTLAFMGDDIVVVDQNGTAYPIFRKINVYTYHNQYLKNITLKDNILRDILTKTINKGINIFRNFLSVSYEIPLYSTGWIGEYDIQELFDIPKGTRGKVTTVGYLEKSDTLKVCNSESDNIITALVNETIAEETWGHVNKFYGIATNIFRINPAVRMYSILQNALEGTQMIHIRLPKIDTETRSKLVSILEEVYGNGKKGIKGSVS